MLLKFSAVALSGFLLSAPSFAQAAGATASGTIAPGAAQMKTVVNPKDGLTYIYIPAGTFDMGCSAGDTSCGGVEKPAHMVTLTKGFWIGQTAVTQAAYKKVIGSNPSQIVGDHFPVIGTNWFEAKAYCEKIDMRLPTEAEWEYAARGGNPSKLYGSVDDIAWYSGTITGTISEVAKKQPNAYGLYDMMGNNFEWVEDWWGPYSAAAVTDPKGPETGTYRVFRGAAWSSAAFSIRVSYRDRESPEEGYAPSPRHAIGMRCVAHKDLAAEAAK